MVKQSTATTKKLQLSLRYAANANECVQAQETSVQLALCFWVVYLPQMRLLLTKSLQKFWTQWDLAVVNGV